MAHGGIGIQFIGHSVVRSGAHSLGKSDTNFTTHQDGDEKPNPVLLPANPKHFTASPSTISHSTVPKPSK